MSQRFRTTVGALACLALGSGVSGLGASAFAHEVPNEANWHILDGTGPGPFAGSHHAPLAFFPALFAQERAWSTGPRRCRTSAVRTPPTRGCCRTAPMGR
jgi:hypothetical protein